MQVNKLQFGQSNYKLDQISLELILANLNQRTFTSFGKIKRTKFKTIGFTQTRKTII
jgi:hypothetical protein